ncbi:RtcB family protein [Candidatus Dependentiae bacterium]|nr:RtcB family protein [Candidatus Dependentiae bacterium]
MLILKNKFEYELEKTGDMVVNPVLYISEKIILENEAVKQLQNVCSIEDSSKVIITPDVHKGFGVPIGCVWASRKFISPAAVGYDINCGMRLLLTPFSSDDVNIKQLADSIRRDIPLGEGKSNITVDYNDLEILLENGVSAIDNIVGKYDNIKRIFNKKDFISDLCSIEENGTIKCSSRFVSDRAKNRGKTQLGTLGGGNHFIELQRVEQIFNENIAEKFGLFKNQFVIMIHSGSRGLGAEIGDNYMKNAVKYLESNNMFMPDRELNYFKADSEFGKNYFESMNSASNYAFINRQIMAMLVRRNIRHYYGADTELPTLYDVSHNILKIEKYNGKDYFVHRKGATRAFSSEFMKNTRFENTGQPVLIPGSMGTSSYILSGKETGIKSFFSVNHGAGRIMSRTKAAGKIARDGKVLSEGIISDETFKKSMEGIYLICENKKTIKEEAPGAYKDIDIVIDIVEGAGLAEKTAKTVPLAVLKG